MCLLVLILWAPPTSSLFLPWLWSLKPNPLWRLQNCVGNVLQRSHSSFPNYTNFCKGSAQRLSSKAPATNFYGVIMNLPWFSLTLFDQFLVFGPLPLISESNIFLPWHSQLPNNALLCDIRVQNCLSVSKTHIFYKYVIFKHPLSLWPNFSAAATPWVGLTDIHIQGLWDTFPSLKNCLFLTIEKDILNLQFFL